MAIRPPQLPPAPRPSIDIRIKTPEWGAAQAVKSRKTPFIDIKGAFKEALKKSTVIGQVKSLINQYKNINSLGGAISAIKNTYTLAKKFGFFGTNKLMGKGSVVKRYGESDRPINPDAEVTQRANSTKFAPDTFFAKIKSSPLAKANRFKVQFTFPEMIKGHVGLFADGLDLMCEQAEFPGRAFNATDSRIYGPVFKTPHESQYAEVNFTILCDQSFSQKFVFDVWMSWINPLTGATGTPGGGWDFEYRDNYISDVIVRQYNEYGDNSYSVKLAEAYPVAVAPLQANWQDDQFHKFQLTMCYRYWLTVASEPSSSAASETGGIGGIDLGNINLRGKPKIINSIDFGSVKKPDAITGKMSEITNKMDTATAKVPTPVKNLGKGALNSLL